MSLKLGSGVDPRKESGAGEAPWAAARTGTIESAPARSPRGIFVGVRWFFAEANNCNELRRSSSTVQLLVPAEGFRVMPFSRLCHWPPPPQSWWWWWWVFFAVTLAELRREKAFFAAAVVGDT